MNKPNKCPSCGSRVFITELSCEKCNTIIKGKFSLNEFDMLEKDEIDFVKIFIASHGNIKDVEKSVGISYPTVKNKLDLIIEKLNISTYDAEVKNKKMEILERLEKNQITAQDAVKLIRESKK